MNTIMAYVNVDHSKLPQMWEVWEVVFFLVICLRSNQHATVHTSIATKRYMESFNEKNKELIKMDSTFMTKPVHLYSSLKNLDNSSVVEVSNEWDKLVFIEATNIWIFEDDNELTANDNSCNMKLMPAQSEVSEKFCQVALATIFANESGMTT